MIPVSSYRIRSVPRFERDEVDLRQYDSAVGRRALWNALLLHLVNRQGLSVELRLVSGDGDDLGVFLRLLGPPGVAFPVELLQLDALLPTDYLWERVEPGVGELASTRRIARLVRRLEYIDLPAVSSLVLRGAMQDLSSSSTSALQGGGAIAPRAVDKGATSRGSLAGIVLGALQGQHEAFRTLPSLSSTLEDIHSRRFCLPLPGPVDELELRPRMLYQSLQQAGRSVVSLCLHRIDADILANARLLAMNWKRFLDPFAGEIASSGFADFRDLRDAYDRYSLPSPYLTNVTIRVAAETDEHAVSLANVVAATLGGAKAFRVFPPSRDVDPAVLVERDVDVLSPRWSPTTLKSFRGALERELQEQGVERPVDDSQLDFLLLVPHVYTAPEAERILRLPVADTEGLPGLDSRLQPPFTLPSLRYAPVTDSQGRPLAPPPERVRVGMVRLRRGSGTDGMAWHTLARDELTKHALVVGSTGSGKTLSTLFLAREMARLQVPFMVVEPVKTEYHQRLSSKLPKVYRLRMEGGPRGGPAGDFLAFDPLRVQKGITIARHASYLKSCFEAAFPLDPVMALLLENGLLEYYTAPVADGGCGLSKFSRGGPAICRIDQGRVFPSFDTFRRFFIECYLPREFVSEQASASSRQHSKDVQGMFARRFANLGNGLIGECFRKADHLTLQDPAAQYDTFGRYLSYPTVVELDAVPDAEHKALLMAFLLTYIFERRQAEDFAARERGELPSSALKHLLIVEEAHRVLSASSARGSVRGESVGQDSKAKAVGLFVDMLAEIRAFGQGLAIVEQIPTKIVPEAVKNTNLKVMLRLTSKDDRDYLGAAMNFTEAQKRFVTNLRVHRGEAVNFVLFEEGVDQPLVVSLPLPAAPAPSWLFDEYFEQEVSHGA